MLTETLMSLRLRDDFWNRTSSQTGLSELVGDYFLTQMTCKLLILKIFGFVFMLFVFNVLCFILVF